MNPHGDHSSRGQNVAELHIFSINIPLWMGSLELMYQAASIASSLESWKTSVFGISIGGWKFVGMRQLRPWKLHRVPMIGVVAYVIFGWLVERVMDTWLVLMASFQHGIFCTYILTWSHSQSLLLSDGRRAMNFVVGAQILHMQIWRL